ncbi:MAG: lipoate--protein ligase family protein [Chloroflexi bacterium]|nr:lipoate--protein ligase family protein [Chloroflexota bacterium]
MAVDESILEAVGRCDVPPTLRLYAWHPACLSLGYAQPVSDVDHEKLSARGWEIVRRITGGRAILHTDELTYSVIGSYSEPRLAGSVLESYCCISQALLAGLQLMKLPAQALPRPQSSPVSGGQPEPICFESPSNYEITVNGRKLIGSAQSSKKAGVIQHGTLPLRGDLTRITQALAFPDEASRSQAAEGLLARATTVESVLGGRVSWAEAASAFVTAFSQTLNLTLEPAKLTPAELARADELVKDKYAHPSWTERI